MKELVDMVSAWQRLSENSQAVLATVVGTSGSTYRKIGARMLVADGQWLAGSLSGGCLESDIIGSAWERTREGPKLVTYDTTADDDIVWGLGLGCNGVVQVLIERVDRDSQILLFLADCVENRQVSVVSTNLSSGPDFGSRGLVATEDELAREVIEQGRAQSTLRSGISYLMEPLIPPRKLYVFGAGHDAGPIVRIANELGLSVSVIDHRAGHLRPEPFPNAELILTSDSLFLEAGSAAVVMSHHYLNDLSYLRKALTSPTNYVGLLGPARRRDKLLAELKSSGLEIDLEMEAKLYSPVGLDLGAEGPEQIAIAILSEILAADHARNGSSLKGTSAPLHEDEGSLLEIDKREDPACGRSA